MLKRIWVCVILAIAALPAIAGTVCYKDESEERCFTQKVDMDLVVELIYHAETSRARYRIIFDKKKDKVTLLTEDNLSARLLIAEQLKLSPQVREHFIWRR